MADMKNLLLVEGEADKAFFAKLCAQIGLQDVVQIAPPKEIGGDYNSKQGVFNHLKNALLPQIDDGRIEKLAVIVDADDNNVGGLGYEKTLERFVDILQPFDFSLSNALSQQKGLYFNHNDGLSDFGAWIMPNNHDAGTLEHWIKSCVKSDESALFQHAVTTVGDLANRNLQKFKPIHIAKAEIATWLAWQKSPSYGVEGVFMNQGSLLDETHEVYRALADWLHKIYRTE